VLLLGLDTATPAVTVALHDGTRVLAEATTVDKHRHAELLMPAIAQVLGEAGAERGDLTAIAVGVGPGPYTGLRVGLVTARVLGAALAIPVHGLCSLDVIAADVALEGFLVATDARRREVYYARYDEAGRAAGPLVAAPADVDGRDALPAVGEGAWLYKDVLQAIEGPRHPAAGTLCRVVAAELNAIRPEGTGRRVPLLPPEPLYLRRPDAREPGAPKRVTETPPPPRSAGVPPPDAHHPADAHRPASSAPRAGGEA
jgi:tRNA threonylcarbamoyladenosine biosynthesis protein TsaB